MRRVTTDGDGYTRQAQPDSELGDQNRVGLRAAYAPRAGTGHRGVEVPG